MTAMRAVLFVLLLLSLAGCVSRALTPPIHSTTTTTTTTTQPVSTNPVKDDAGIQRGVTTVRTWLTNCAPGLPRAPGCGWAAVDAVAMSVIDLIDHRVATSPRPDSHWHLDAATSDAFEAFDNFGESCVEWLNSGDSPDVMVKLNCANLWTHLPYTWAALEAAVVQ